MAQNNPSHNMRELRPRLPRANSSMKEPVTRQSRRETSTVSDEQTTEVIPPTPQPRRTRTTSRAPMPQSSQDETRETEMQSRPVATRPNLTRKRTRERTGSISSNASGSQSQTGSEQLPRNRKRTRISGGDAVTGELEAGEGIASGSGDDGHLTSTSADSRMSLARLLNGEEDVPASGARTPPTQHEASPSNTPIIDLTTDTPIYSLPPRNASAVIDLSDTPAFAASERNTAVPREPVDLTQDDVDEELQVVHHIPGRTPPRRRTRIHRMILEQAGPSLAASATGWIGSKLIIYLFNLSLGLNIFPVGALNRMLNGPSTAPVRQPPLALNTGPPLVLSSPTAFNSDSRPRPPTPEPEDPAALRCAICLGVFGATTPLSATICGHIFCEGCIQDALKVQKKCPICRKDLKSKNSVHRLYIS